VRLTQCGLVIALTGVEPATGKAHLAAMVTQMHGSTGEQHLGTVGAVGEQDEHGRRAGPLERRIERTGMQRLAYTGEHLGGA